MTASVFLLACSCFSPNDSSGIGFLWFWFDRCSCCGTSRVAFVLGLSAEIKFELCYGFGFNRCFKCALTLRCSDQGHPAQLTGCSSLSPLTMLLCLYPCVDSLILITSLSPLTTLLCVGSLILITSLSPLTTLLCFTPCGFFNSDRFTFSTHHRGAVPGTNWLHGGEHSAVWTSSDPVKDYDSGLVHAQVPFY